MRGSLNARSMPKYRLTYFDFSGSRGEECRLALFASGVDFEDHRIDRPAWQALKPTTPFGSLPVLEREGHAPLAQSNAILAYVGRSYGLYPSDPWEAARHDALLAAAEELRVLVAPTGNAPTPEAKRQAREEFARGPLQSWAERLERQLQGPFVAGESMFVTDIKIFQVMRAYYQGVIEHISGDAFQAYPKLCALYAAVGAHPKVVEWSARH